MQSYHYNRLMSKSSRCYSAAANRKKIGLRECCVLWAETEREF
ncbi:hypothetical protein RGQ29_001611 [Quercus rubra]|uniref:Uncharacterized protein n=1 Tax=Quercus rubra TaxID=3512 RepID=A0AAN7GC04_QUERU|nr:hypothetical protein RGQ29_001611 [Quercus rubra]